MITVIQPKNQCLSLNIKQQSWQKALAQAIRDPKVLLQRLNLPLQAPFNAEAQQSFRLLVPESLLARIKPGDWDDPILKQVLPMDQELQSPPDYGVDPVADVGFMTEEGVLQKYHGRALLITTGACAVHCRYCFRRHFPYSEANAAQLGWRNTLDYLQQHPDISELILSGGDPLTLSDQRLHSLTEGVRAIPHIRRLRIHTRLPVVLPERISAGFLEWLRQCPIPVVMVLHINHAQELEGFDVVEALRRLKASGITLLNQAVLLKGVNDSLEAQIALHEACFAQGVLPYYLHVLDKVEGAAHFFIDDVQAAMLIQQVRESLPGYLVPRLVRENAGELSKTPLV